MKILYVGNFSLPDLDAAAIRVSGNGLALKEYGVEVVYIDAQKAEKCDCALTLHYVNGFKVYSRKVHKNKILDYCECMFRISHIKRIAEEEKVDAIIAYNYSSIALKRIVNYCKKYLICCISDCTEWYSAKNYGFPLSVFSAIDTLYRMRIVNKECDGIITVSSYLDNYYFKQNHFRVPFYMDCHHLDCIKPNVGFSSENVNIIYGGTPGKNKEKLQDVLYGVKESLNYSNITLRITGLTREQYLDEYPEDKWIENNKQIHFLGRVSRDENLSLIKASDFLIFYRNPTRQNTAGFPTKFVEAVGVGTPVVTTDTTDLKECSKKNNIPTTFVANKEEISAFFSRNIENLKCYKLKATKTTKVFDYSSNSQQFYDWIQKMLSKKK